MSNNNNHKKLNLVNNQLFSRLNIYQDHHDDGDNDADSHDHGQEQAQSKSVAQQVPRDQSPMAIGGALKNVIQKHDFTVFLSNPSGGNLEVTGSFATGNTSHVAAALTPTAAVVMDQKQQQQQFQQPAVLTKEKSRAILSAVLQTANRVTPVLSLKRSIDKNKPLVLNPTVSTIVVLQSFDTATPHSGRAKVTETIAVEIAPESGAITADLSIDDKASGSSDPYVCVHLAPHEDDCHKSKSSHQNRTSTKKAELNPVWDETFVIKSNKPEENTLILSVFDSDLVTKDDFMGTIHIPISDAAILPLNSITSEYFLQPKEKKPGFFSRLAHKDANRKEEFEAHLNSDQSLGSIKLSYYYVKRDLERNDSFDIVPEEIKKMIKINHDQHMTELIDYIVSIPSFKSNYIFPEELHSMLKDFEQRVGISSITRLTCIIDHTVQIFLISMQQLNLISSTLSLLQKDLIEDKSINLTNEINNKLTISIKALKQIFKNVISRYGLSFPVNMNERGEITGITEENGKLLTLSIKILNQIHSIRSFQKGEVDDSSKFKLKIDKYVMDYFKIFFGMVKENSEVSIEDSKDFQNIVGLLDVYDAIELQISNDIDIYSKYFGSELSKKSAVAYYNLLKEETIYILSKETGVCMESFTLLKKIQKLHTTTLKPYINGVFSPFVDMWVEEAKTQFNTWMTRSIHNEQWRSIDAKNKILHSNSVMDLFHMFEIGKNHLIGLNLNVDKQLMTFNQLVIQCYQDYLDSIMDVVLIELGDDDYFQRYQRDVSAVAKFLSIFKDIGGSNSPSRERSSSVTKNTSISLSICVKLNCIETSRQLLDDFIENLTSKFQSLQTPIEDAFAKSISNAKRQIEYLTDLVIGKIGSFVNMCIGDIISKSASSSSKTTSPRGGGGGGGGGGDANVCDEAMVSELLQPLFSYLTNELSLLSSNLYQPTFSRFIRGVWMCIWKECERILFPDCSLQKVGDDVIIKQIYMMLSLYNQLESFFYSDGDGMRLELLRSHASPLFRTLPIYFSPTPLLIELHRQLVSGSMSNSVSVTSATDLTVSFEKIPALPKQFGLPDFKNHDTKFILSEVHIMSPLASRQKESEASKYVKSNKQNYKNRYLIDKFELPNKSLNVVEKFKCRSSLGIPTILYLVDDHLCISTILSYSETNTAIKYQSLTKLIKQHIQDKETLTVLVSEKSYDLWGFNDSKKSKLYKTVIQLASKVNEALKIEEPHITLKSQDIEHEFFSNLFKLPKNEKIIANYSCMRKGLYGRITITNHYFCFQNHITSSTEKYEWTEVNDIKKINSLFTSGIQVTIRNEKMKFNGFENRDQYFSQIIETKTKSL
ncbi:hypothetical protein PPL_01115 [Heterostelium album PN500]|uniref:C2 domain-containing protein n=1 Tax=Heterostelium pallidum (strain ATCC 26659 / Pp 5 / PN500) TaxID=670386 RepID=D3AY56_HETP5|nr:hypothetical protein PPL_01115 [Heterostelium album PN500]EFA85883.1 hypothetical protein PPL_01115 [Heterostelium album PN500]|eukprot:XP_020437989.1 hypothetical protein PPL_01115 [Heterostelium album PN500]